MKKSLLLAAVFMASFCLSCIKENPSKVTISFCAESPKTKTVFGEKNVDKTYPVLWTNADNVGIGLGSSWSTVPITPLDGGTSAEFSGSFEEASSYHFMLMSPASAIKDLYHDTNTFYAEIPAIQTPTPSGPDPAAQLLYVVAEYESTAAIPNPISLAFSHFTAYLHITLTGVELPSGNTLQSVVITGGDGCFLAGRNKLVASATPAFTDEVVRASKSITVDASNLSINSSSLDIWCGVRAGDFSGKELTFEINTDQKYLTKTITMRANSELDPGGVAAFSVGMAGLEWQTPVEYVLVDDVNDLHWGDEIIIAAAESETEDNNIALGITQNTNNRSGSGITRINNKILNPSSSVELIQLRDGLIPGAGTFALYATRTSGYLYSAGTSGSTSNVLKTMSDLDARGTWNISFGPSSTGAVDSEWFEKETLAIIKAEQSDNNRPYLRYNPADKLFASYTKNTTQSPVRIYRKNQTPDSTPRFNVTDSQGNTPSDANVSYEAHTIPIYVFGNVDWTATVTGDGASLSEASGTGGAIVILTIPENTDKQNTKSYSVTVSTGASVATQSFSLSLTQAKAVDTSGDPVSVYSFSLSNPNIGTNGSYAGNCNVTIGGIVWNVTGVSNSTSYHGWRIGGKSLTNVDRCIYSKTPIMHEVTKVVVSHCRKNITLNSLKLTVHESAADAASGANPIATISKNSISVGTQDAPAATEFEKTDNTSWAGCYYRLAYNVTNTSSADNKYVEFRGLEMWGYPAD